MSLTDTLAADRTQALIRIRRRLLADPLLHRANEPELWPAYVPDGVTQYLRLFSEWGGTKLDRISPCASRSMWRRRRAVATASDR